MGNSSGKDKYDRLLEEEKPLMDYLKTVDVDAVKLINSYYRMKVATELMVNQLKHMLDDRNLDYIKRSSDLGAELLETLKDDLGMTLQKAMTDLSSALRKLPFKHKKFQNITFEIDSYLSVITNTNSEEERQARNLTQKPGMSIQTANSEDEDKQKSLRDKTDDKAEKLVAENKKLTDENTLLNQKLKDIRLCLTVMKSDFISKEKDESSTPRNKAEPADTSAVCELLDVLEDNPEAAHRKQEDPLLGNDNSRINSYSHAQESEVYEDIDILLEWLQNKLDMKVFKINEYREKATAILQQEQLKEVTNEKMEDLPQEKVILQEQYRELPEINRQKTDELTQEILELRDQLENKSMNVESLQQLHKSAIDEITSLRDEVQKLQQKPLCRVQMFSPLHRKNMVKMENEIMSIIKDTLGANISQFDLVQCEQKTELCPSFPIIVLCINVLRLGTDVSAALQDLQPNSKMAVVIFHHKNVHALPNQDSEKVLVNPSFKALGGIFDIGFQHETGIYDCDMNERNISKLIAFILKQVQAM